MTARADAASFESTAMPLRRRTRRAPLPLVIAALLVALLMLAPPVYLLIRATDAGADAYDLITRERNRVIMWNSIKLSTAVGVTGACIGVPIAWLLDRSDMPCRRFFSLISPLPLAIPSYIGAMTFIEAFGPQGILKDFLNEQFGVTSIPSIYGFWGSFLALTAFTFPFVLLQVRASFRRLDSTVDDAARSLGYGAWRTFVRTTLPMLRPSIAAGMLLAMLYTISDFGVVTLLRYDTFTRAIYTQYRASFNRSNAAVLALMLVLFAAVLVSAEITLRGRTVYHRIGSGARRTPNRVHLGWWRIPALLFCSSIFSLAVGVPVAVIIWWLVDRQGEVTSWSRLGEAIRHSVELGLLAGLATLLLALPVAILSVRYPGRLGSAIERICYLGFGLPGIVIALTFVFFGIRVATPLYQTVWLLLIAMAIRYLPHALGAERAALLQISPRVEEAARTLGRTSSGAFRHVTLPLARPGFVAGFVLVFVSVVKELPITLLLSPIEYRTLATEIWTSASSGAYSDAAVPALILLIVASLPTVLLRSDNRLETPGNQ